MSFTLAPVTRGRSWLLIASFVTVCGAGLTALQWATNRNEVFADQLAIRRPQIPSSLIKIPVESKPAVTPNRLHRAEVKYYLGDHLKITLFEKVDLSNEEQNNIPATGLVERTELTGDYVVQGDGYIVLPLLGAVEADGQSAEQVVEALQAAFSAAMGRPARASVVLLEREPVYLMGKGMKPGTFKYSPGMTVLHAIALSGAGKEENSDLYAHTEYARGVEKLEISTQRLEKQLARAAAARAQQSGQPAEIPPRLIELAGAKEAKKLVESAVAVRKLIMEARQPQIAAYQAALAAARQEAESHANRIALLHEHAKLHLQRRDAVAELRARNDVSASTLVQIENEVAIVKEKKEEAVASLAKAHDNIAQAEQNLAKLETGLILELQNEIITTDNEISELEATVSSSRRLTSDLRVASLRMASNGQNLSYEIVRRSKDGLSRIKATDTAELVPGDLIQVTSVGGEPAI